MVHTLLKSGTYNELDIYILMLFQLSTLELEKQDFFVLSFFNFYTHRKLNIAEIFLSN